MKLTHQDFQKYLNLGLSVVGIPHAKEYVNKNGEHKKRVIFPKGGWAQFQDNLASESELDDFVKRGSELIGLVTGKLSGIVVIDVDEAHSSKYDFLKTPMRVKSSLSGGTHYYFRWTDELDQFGNATKVMDYKMDYRGRGGLVFAPGSKIRKIDGSEGTYDFIGEMDLSNFDLSKLPELPDEILINLSEEKPATLEVGYLEEGKNGLLLPELHEGNRNAETVRVIGSVLSKSDPSIWEGVIYPALRIWNQEKVVPPQDEVALRASFNQIVSRELKKRDDELIFNVKEKTGFKDILEQQMSERTDDKFFSGYEEVDEITGGFRYQNTYLVAGLEKSGKSSWSMGMLQHKLNSGETKIGYVNTEMPVLEFVKRMSAYWKEIEYSDVTDEMMTEWSYKFSDKFSYLGVESLTDIDQMIKDITVFIKNINCLVFDNITSWGLRMVKGKEAYQVTGDLMNQLINLGKKHKVVTFMVMHMKPDIVVNSALRVNEKAIQEYKDNPESIFQRSESFVRKPSLADVYGGGAALSQISGAVLIWRPYQKFENEEMNSCTQILLESFRHSKQAAIKCYFDGKTGKFTKKKYENFERIVSSMGQMPIDERRDLR